ncbi:hypothetical protein P7K49_025435 [Saguinus oedipus]|uniref:NACHT LRR and PYD domain-containing protein n=1 Tax=Saguinus oedipus TaxID=9490 RepID=A0ABQ9UH72_SAGOE|nr:hypothetical protein P7K49_025435 [Saguinus oedipus]
MGPRGGVRVPPELSSRTPKATGHAAPAPRKRPPPARRACDRGPGFGRKEEEAQPRAPRRLPRPGGKGRNPRPEASARRGQAPQGPSSGAARAPEDPTRSCGARSRFSPTRGASGRQAQHPHLPCALWQPSEQLHPPLGEAICTSKSSSDFCTALYYVLEGLDFEPVLCLLFKEKGKRLVELKQAGFHSHLLWMKRFLFGLMNEDVRRPLEVLLGCPVSLGVKQKLLHWVSLLGQQTNATS